MTHVGDIWLCSNWYHGDQCANEDCKRGWRERGEDWHRDCTWCGGTKRMRVTEIREGGRIIIVEGLQECTCGLSAIRMSLGLTP